MPPAVKHEVIHSAYNLHITRVTIKIQSKEEQQVRKAYRDIRLASALIGVVIWRIKSRKSK